MKKLSLVLLTICGLTVLSCRKETNGGDDVRYSNFYVRSPKDPTKLITIEEYNRLYPPSKINGDRSWEDCFFENRNGDYEKGRNCSNTRHYGCDEPQGCHKK